MNLAHLLEAVSVRGRLNEELRFHESISAEITIEYWLGLMERRIQKAVSIEIKNCLTGITSGRFSISFGGVFSLN